MKLKDYSKSPPNGGFTFFYYNLQKEYMQVKGNSITQLELRSRTQMQNQGLTVPDNLREVIEHQICLRQPDPGSVCWSSGLGDVIHQDIAKPVANVVSKIAKSLGMPKIAKAVKKMGGCSSCCGSKTYTQGENNLGRAGKVNKVFTFKR